MKIRTCDCGCYAFVAIASDGTKSVMCNDRYRYDHRFGPKKKRARPAIRAWNRWARKGFQK